MVDIDVHVLDRGHITADRAFMIDGDAMGTLDAPQPEHHVIESPVYNLLLDTPDGVVLWDTGSHPDAGDGYWPDHLYSVFAHEDASEHTLPGELDRHGYDLDDIDAVVMSHLHLDHAGGLRHFDGTDVPVYVHEREIEYAYRSANTATGSVAYFQPDFDHDLNWQVVTGERTQYFAGVEFLHLPGHTPGLLGLLLHRDEGTLVVAGDEVYRRENYEQGVPMSAGLLSGLDDWRESRARVQDLARRHDAPVFCGHDQRDVDQLEAIVE
ncbi:N-acyl homoserine lactonase family protein [Halocalculus aciditolerans]|uniref:MBL fold metallo-hydrolase n=1 Tax=Halocalculus aciditolerans TaxID=1383812 RepID=A0A830FHL2_9EURY|nr:N-acyl homoserine lactonase family protein [Halocalculus aciditolerans]GGL56012.1 MBL fold metallo-hydrolase [Halocalculus aciditolerans]